MWLEQSKEVREKGKKDSRMLGCYLHMHLQCPIVLGMLLGTSTEDFTPWVQLSL